MLRGMDLSGKSGFWRGRRDNWDSRIIVIIRIFLRRGFRASCCSFRYSLSTAFNSFRNEIINSFSEILLSSKIITSQAIENSLLVTKE